MKFKVDIDGDHSTVETHDQRLPAILASLCSDPAALAVRLNGRPVRRQMMEATTVQEGDRLELKTTAARPARTRGIFPIRSNTSADEVLYTIRKWAGDVGYHVTPDQRQLNALVKGLVKNSTKYGEPLCPCMPKEITGDPDQDVAIACPCVYVDADIAVQGACKCKLFVSKEYHDESLRSLEAMKDV